MQAQACVPRPERTLNRWRLGTLKTSQRNCRLWFSLGIFQRLLRARSKPAYPSPRTTFLEPLSPGKGWTKLLLNADAGLAKTLTVPSDCLKAPVFGLEVIRAIPCSSQSVGQKLPLSTVKGKPLVQRARPESCQPPMNASAVPPALAAKCLPLPKGRSTIQLALI